MTLAYLAVVLATSRPAAGGICLGLAMAKPHVAGPVFLWALFTRRMRLVAVASGVVAAAFAVYCARVAANPAAVFFSWIDILSSYYYGTDTLVGRSSLRPLWHLIAGSVESGDVLWLVAAGGLLLIPCAITMAERGSGRTQAAAGRALFSLWSLLTIFHLGNNLVVLMFPAFAFLLLINDPVTQRPRLILATIIQLAMMLDIPVHAESILGDTLIAALCRHLDRIVTLLTFAYITYWWYVKRRVNGTTSQTKAVFPASKNSAFQTTSALDPAPLE
jgi:hypothetical protein